MQRFSPALTSFSGGEVGPLTFGRTDIEQYNQSLRLCDNWIPTLQGPLVKRKGTQFIASTKDNEVARLIPYRGTGTNGYMLVFTHTDAEDGGSIRVYDESGTYTGVDIISPYVNDEQLAELQFAQKEDLLFIVQKDFKPYVFFFDGTTATMIGQSFDFGPIDNENLDSDLTFRMASNTGTGFINLEFLDGGTPQQIGDLFLNTDLLAFRTIPQALHDQWITSTAYSVGDYVWSNSYESDRVNVYKATTAATSGTRSPGHDSGTESDGVVSWQMVHSEYGFVDVGFPLNPTDLFTTCKIVGFPEVPTDTTTGDGVTRWSFGLWSSFGDAFDSSNFGKGPSTVTFHEQRVIYGGNVASRQLIHGSKIDEFTNFYPGSLLANAAYQYTINSSDINQIRFLVSAQSLFIGTESGLFSARASSNGAITPTDIVMERSSNRGAKEQQAVQVGESVLFVQKGGATMRETVFDNDIKGFNANDLSILSHHIGANGLNRIAFQKEPQTILWTYSNSGVLVGLTYERQHGVVGWHQHNIAADSTGAAVVEDVATLQDENGVNDKLWMIVKRVINSSTVRYIEIIDSTTPVWSDSYITYDGAATTTITGLSHLEGETVKVIGDGAVMPDQTVSSGEIELPSEVTTAAVGLGYIAKGKTQKIEGGSQTGTSQGKLKRIQSVVLRLIDAGPGLLIGQDENSQLDRVIYRVDSDLMDTPVPLFSGDTDTVPMDQDYESGGMIYFEHNLPFDCTITAMWPQMFVEDAT